MAHVHFGNEIIEVATFRAAAAPEREDSEDEDADGNAERDADRDSEHRAFDLSGRILRDNIYGTIEEDVWRRDFSANGLYYNIEDFSIWDFVNGVSDVRARRLKLIGDPETRYREDPVRMLRAARFEAKLAFTLEDSTAAPMASLRHLLAGVPPPRLFETAAGMLNAIGLQNVGVRAFLDEKLPKLRRLKNIVVLANVFGACREEEGGIVMKPAFSSLKDEEP